MTRPSSLTRGMAAGLATLLGAFAYPVQAGPPPGAPDDYVIQTIGYAMLGIPAGHFEMGCSLPEQGCGPWDSTHHPVRLTRPFWAGTTEVTWAQWRTVMEFDPTCRAGDLVMDETHIPLQCASWLQVVDFLNRLSAAEGLDPVYGRDTEGVTWDTGADGYRLPTEAEWEYLARAGTDSRFSWGEAADMEVASTFAWFEGNATRYYALPPVQAGPRPVGTRASNAWGLYDTTGNLREWCWDAWGMSGSPEAPAVDPTGPQAGSLRVTRGGGWSDTLADISVFKRTLHYQDSGCDLVGFRIVRTVPPER